jgi:hypothetical protein
MKHSIRMQSQKTMSWVTEHMKDMARLHRWC